MYFRKTGLQHIKKADMDGEWNHYGGFIIAESVPPEMAQALVDAYNEKYAPKESSAHSFTEGAEPIQSPAVEGDPKPPDWVKKHNQVVSNGFYEYIPQSERDKVVDDLVEDLSRLMDTKVARRIANNIITAIETMDQLKRKIHGEQN